jgi:hypothetical protein
MTPRRAASAGRRFLRTLALVNLGICLGVAVVCWLGGWRSLAAYADGLTYAGLAVLAFGGIRYLAAEHTGDRALLGGLHAVDLGELSRQRQRAEAESDSAFVLMLKLGLVGLVPIVLGQLLKAIAA